MKWLKCEDFSFREAYYPKDFRRVWSQVSVLAQSLIVNSITLSVIRPPFQSDMFVDIAYTPFNSVTLRTLISEGLTEMNPELIRKLFWKVRSYEKVYREGAGTSKIDKYVK